MKPTACLESVVSVVVAVAAVAGDVAVVAGDVAVVAGDVAVAVFVVVCCDCKHLCKERYKDMVQWLPQKRKQNPISTERDKEEDGSCDNFGTQKIHLPRASRSSLAAGMLS